MSFNTQIIQRFQDVNYVKVLALEMISNVLGFWSSAIVRTVPGVMTQVRLKESDRIQYQINWFLDCSETYIHNHAHFIYTYCLEGGYLEKQWEIVDDDSQSVTYRFRRYPGNKFDAPEKLDGKIDEVRSREHFPGNLMFVHTTQYHSILPHNDYNERALTFVIKQTHSSNSPVHILSQHPTIEAPTDEIIQATIEEKAAMKTKLQQVLRKSCETHKI